MGNTIPHRLVTPWSVLGRPRSSLDITRVTLRLRNFSVRHSKGRRSVSKHLLLQPTAKMHGLDGRGYQGPLDVSFDAPLNHPAGKSRAISLAQIYSACSMHMCTHDTMRCDICVAFVACIVMFCKLFHRPSFITLM